MWFSSVVGRAAIITGPECHANGLRGGYEFGSPFRFPNLFFPLEKCTNKGKIQSEALKDDLSFLLGHWKEDLDICLWKFGYSSLKWTCFIVTFFQVLTLKINLGISRKNNNNKIMLNWYYYYYFFWKNLNFVV